MPRFVTSGPSGLLEGFLKNYLPDPKDSNMNKLFAALLASLFAVSTAFAASHSGAPMAATPAKPAAAGAAATPAIPSPAASKGVAMKEEKATKKTAKKATKKTAKKEPAKS